MKHDDIFCFDTDKGRELLASLLACIEENGMWEILKKGALLGFSGGADSVFLALALLYLKETKADFALCLCHVHHGIRTDGADRDLEFAQTFAKVHSLELATSRYDIPSLAREQGLGIEECARNVRYSTFDKIIRGRNDIFCILTAHNATDNVETVIQRLMRGTGLQGLCGISPVRDGRILRPLLYVKKSDIVEFLDANGISYVVDETNQDIHYTRNFIRNEILPDLARITPNPEVSIQRFVKNLREDELCLSDIAERFLSTQKMPYISISDFLALPCAIQYRVLCRMAKEENASFMLQRTHLDLILDATRKKVRERISLAHSFDFVLEKGKMYFERKCESETPQFSLKLNSPHFEPYFEATFLFLDEAQYQSSKNVYKNSISVSLSSDIIKGDLYVRGRNSQDSYRVRKMTRKLKTMIQALHLPKARANKIPVICDEKGILYVPPFGLREESDVDTVSTRYYIMIIYGDGVKAPWRD